MVLQLVKALGIFFSDATSMSVETDSLDPRPFPDVAGVKDNSSCVVLRKEVSIISTLLCGGQPPASVQCPAMANDVTVGNPGPNTTCY